MTRGLPALLVAALAACSQVQVNNQTQGSGTATGASSTGSTGGSTSGGTSTSTTGGQPSDGGCATDRTSAQGDDCIPSYPCGCPFVCTTDALESLVYRRAGNYVCELRCTTNDDCPTTDTACIDGVCGAVPCGGGVGNGVFDSECAMGAVADSGTCIPIPLQFVGVDAGLCMQGGSATVTCNPYANERSQAATICIPGFICNGLVADGGLCLRACDDDQGCPAGEFCSASEQTPTDGVCLDAGSRP